MNANAALPETLSLFAAALSDDAACTLLLDRLDGPPERNRKRFAAYRRNVIGNWIGALESAYPVVRRLVGEAFFREAGRTFAFAQPSRSGDLNDYGGGFADFLAAYPHAAALPYLADVARLDWRVQTSYFAADAPTFDFSAFAASLAGLPAARHGEVRCRFAPAFAALESPWPVAAIWLAHQHAEVAPLAFTPGPHHAWVLRPHGRVVVAAVDAASAHFVAALRGGATLGEAIDAALAQDPGFDPGARLHHLIDAGALIGVLAPSGDTP